MQKYLSTTGFRELYFLPANVTQRQKKAILDGCSTVVLKVDWIELGLVKYQADSPFFLYDFPNMNRQPFHTEKIKCTAFVVNARRTFTFHCFSFLILFNYFLIFFLNIVWIQYHCIKKYCPKTSTNEYWGQSWKQACLCLSLDRTMWLNIKHVNNMLVTILKYILIDWLIEALNLPQFTCFSGRFAPCKRFDISQLCLFRGTV